MFQLPGLRCAQGLGPGGLGLRPGVWAAPKTSGHASRMQNLV